MSFIDEWQKADEQDFACGGMDSVPEWEEEDYRGALLVANGFVWAGLMLGKEGAE